MSIVPKDEKTPQAWTMTEFRTFVHTSQFALCHQCINIISVFTDPSMTPRRVEKLGEQIEFYKSASFWAESRDNGCPLCTLLIDVLPVQDLNIARAVYTMRRILEVEFVRRLNRTGLWTSAGRSFEGWVSKPLSSWINYLGNEPFMEFASTGEKETACALFLDWNLKYNNRAADLALSAPLPADDLRKIAQIFHEETNYIKSNAQRVPLIKEDYARRGWILGLHLSPTDLGKYTAFRVYAQPGINLHYVETVVMSAHVSISLLNMQYTSC
jgi:hypothetical protein